MASLSIFGLSIFGFDDAREQQWDALWLVARSKSAYFSDGRY